MSFHWGRWGLDSTTFANFLPITFEKHNLFEDVLKSSVHQEILPNENASLSIGTFWN